MGGFCPKLKCKKPQNPSHLFSFYDFMFYILRDHREHHMELVRDMGEVHGAARVLLVEVGIEVAVNCIEGCGNRACIEVGKDLVVHGKHRADQTVVELRRVQPVLLKVLLHALHSKDRVNEEALENVHFL